MLEVRANSRPARAVLKEARTLLTSIGADNPGFERAIPSSSGDGKVPGSFGNLPLLQCARLVEDFRQLLRGGCVLQPREWTVVKAVVELVVRWGIYPYLSSGVGVPLQQRFGENAAAAAAAAVSDHVRGLTSGVGLDETAMGVHSTESRFETHPLALSAELLASLAMETGEGKESIVSSVISHSSGTKEESGGGSENLEGKHSLECTSSSSSSSSSSSAMALRQLVVSHHLVDVLAALVQLAHGPGLSSGEQLASKSWKEGAVERIGSMVQRLPVPYLVEALFSLLGQEGTKGPPWLKSEVGKLLSQVVMRNGGIATVMERLVGSAEKGSVHIYERVAAHLARVPRYVSTADEYYKVVGNQLQPLLLFQHSSEALDTSSDVASKLRSNMLHTSILLACTLAHQEPSLAEKYLLRPLVEPLIAWHTLQTRNEACFRDNVDDKCSQDEREEKRKAVTESSLVASLMKVQVLLLAGHKGSLNLQQHLLQLTSSLAPWLLLLNYLLWPSYTGHEVQRLDIKSSGPFSSGGAEGKNSLSRHKDKKIDLQKVFPRGFLNEKHLSSSDAAEESRTGVVNKCASAIFDIVLSHLKESTAHAVPIVCTFLFNLDAASLEWPSADGEISKALAAGRKQSDSAAMSLSKLLRAGECWELAIALLDVMLRQVLRLRKDAKKRASYSSHGEVTSESVTSETSLSLLQSLETIYVEVGLKAVEQAAGGALSLLKALLDDDELLEDSEMLELVLSLVHSAIRQLRQTRNSREDDTKQMVLKRTEQGEVLKSIGLSLEKVASSTEVTAEVQNFVATLRSTICDLDRDLTI